MAEDFLIPEVLGLPRREGKKSTTPTTQQVPVKPKQPVITPRKHELAEIREQERIRTDLRRQMRQKVAYKQAATTLQRIEERKNPPPPPPDPNRSRWERFLDRVSPMPTPKAKK